MVRVRVLGALAVEGVDLARLGSRKARRLLARLALARGRPVGTDALVELLWPDPDRPANPADQVSVLVSRTRAVLGADRLPRTSAGYALRADWLDLDALAELAAEARRRLGAGSPTPAWSAADAALALYRGPLLADEPPADWLDAERVSAERTAGAARLVAAEAALAAGDPWSAAERAAAVLALEPYQEAALRVLMRALAGSGRPGRALSVYAEAAARLRDELGVDPAPETRAVHVDLLRAEPAAVPAPADLPPAALPGRAGELESLNEAYATAAAGRPVLVRVDGEAGIGKTRLLRA